MAEPERTMQVIQVDERDSGWEDPDPRFRVYLHGSGVTSTGGWTDTYDITGADVLQVIDWAQRQAGDQLTYAVALVRDDKEQERINPGFGRGLVWLVGMDGNDSTDEGSAEREVQRRMLLRRLGPVGIPEADRAAEALPNPVTTPSAGIRRPHAAQASNGSRTPARFRPRRSRGHLTVPRLGGAARHAVPWRHLLVLQRGSEAQR